MVKNPEYEKLLEQIDEITQTGSCRSDVESQPEDREILELAKLMVEVHPPASETFRRRLKHRLMLDERVPDASRERRWENFRSKLSRSQLVALAAAMSLILVSSAALAVPMVRELIFKPTKGNLILDSIPTRATVVLDDREIGMTPVTVREIKTGIHRLKISYENFEDWSGNITVKENKTLKVTVELTGIEVIEIKPTQAKKGEPKTTATPAQIPAETQALIKDQPEKVQGETPAEASIEPAQANKEDSAVQGDDKETSNANPSSLKTEPYVVAVKNNRLGSYGLISKTFNEIAIGDISGQLSASLGADKILVQTEPKTICILRLGDNQAVKEAVFDAGETEQFVNPQWSGSSIIAGITGNGKPRIVELSPDRIQPRLIYEGSAQGAFQPGGRLLAVAAADGLYVKDLKSGESERVFSGALVQMPAWSPSGSKLAFVATSRRAGVQQLALFVVDRDGTDLFEIDRQAISYKWSPDGQRIAYDASRNSRSSVYLFDTQTASLSRMVDSASSPVFDRDGYLSYLKLGNVVLLTLEKLEEQELVKDSGFSYLIYSRGLAELVKQ